ncbi:hypothetical protein ABTM84_19715 [Acinetobacter baumannii]
MAGVPSIGVASRQIRSANTWYAGLPTVAPGSTSTFPAKKLPGETPRAASAVST